MADPRVAVLVDLPREGNAGGHVKYWERVAQAAVQKNAPLDLTIYFSGTGEDDQLSSRVRFRYLPPVFSTANLKFLPYVPAHTDLAWHHPKLARQLSDYDVLHTTDAYFAFARTAERVSKLRDIPLVTSLHTDTPAYAELFTRQTLRSLLGKKLGNVVDSSLAFSRHQRLSKEHRLAQHLKACDAILAMRPEDKLFARKYVSAEKLKPMRLGVNKELFKPQPDARAEIERTYGIAPRKCLALFVGRVDAGKNVPLLVKAFADALRKGVNLHLLVAGVGPLCDEVKAALGSNATLVGLVPTEKLARLYAAADCLCMASDIEIGGLVGVEALASGCPVLVSQKSGVAALCGNTLAMKEVASDVTAWSENLSFFAHSAAQQAEMRQAALTFRDNAIAEWNDVLTADFLPVWQSVKKESL
jgi:glycosyltransferase involved in cell wall biosynthesis